VTDLSARKERYSSGEEKVSPTFYSAQLPPKQSGANKARSKRINYLFWRGDVIFGHEAPKSGAQREKMLLLKVFSSTSIPILNIIS